MAHPLVEQLRFARSEFDRALAGLSDADARRRFPPMNCISWNVGHMAWQEQRYWLQSAQRQLPFPEVYAQFANGAPACEPPLGEIRAAWEAITAAADPWLDELTSAQLQEPQARGRGGGTFNYGSLLQRTIYHYWYHIGESMAVRQLLGHADLGEFVGNIDDEAPYRSDVAAEPAAG